MKVEKIVKMREIFIKFDEIALEWRNQRVSIDSNCWSKFRTLTFAASCVASFWANVHGRFCEVLRQNFLEKVLSASIDSIDEHNIFKWAIS